MILDCNEIIANRLWVGRYIRPEDVKLLRKMGISAVVNLQSEEDFVNYSIPFNKLLKAYTQAEIELRHIPILDFNEEALAANLVQGVKEIEEALTPRWAKIYLHCTAGINRGPTLAAAYLIKAQGLSAREAYDFVAAQRHCSPSLGILEQYETSLKNMS